MDTNEKKIDFQIQLWALLGPIIALATASTLFYHGSSHNHYLAWLLPLGLIVCWKWKVRGLMAALACLVASIGYHYPSLPLDERLWHLGVSVAIALTFFVTAISFEEIERMLLGLEKESSSRLKSLLQLDERLEMAQSALSRERLSIAEEFERERLSIAEEFEKERLSIAEELERERLSIAEELEMERAKIASYERLIEVTRQEMLDTHETQEKLLQELFERRQEVAQLKEQVEAVKGSEEGEATSKRNFEAMYKQLRTQFDEKCKLLDAARKDLFHAKERAMCFERENEERSLDRSELERGLEKCLIEIEFERDQLVEEVSRLHELVNELSLVHH